ncbi:MAG: 6-phosphofructokinase [Chloroflexi bacterium]|nr:6-phosphofructokinase [Chloroflexota bacterium]
MPQANHTPHIRRLAVLTSGGDAQGMNAAVRAVVRAGLNAGMEVYAIHQGYHGLVRGGDNIRQMSWNDVGGVLQQGGTIIGSARSQEFLTREGRRRAAHHLVSRGIQGLVVIGGDGSLTGANVFYQEWPGLLAELVAAGKIEQTVADAHPHLPIVGMVGSIDNDMFGTDMTIGADTALHRIVEALDAIASTAASHQRTFVVELMGRRCGYLTMMAGLAAGASWVLIPEYPPPTEHWEDMMCEVVQAGRDVGRRHSIVLVAEGAQDRNGNPISSQYVRDVLSERLGVETRLTILGHVQRGGSPSAFDRNMSTVLGYAAVQELARVTVDAPPKLLGVRDDAVIVSSLEEMVLKTQQVAQTIREQKYHQAMEMRGRGFVESFHTFRTLLRAQPRPPKPDQKTLRLAILHSGSTAPGMNTAVRVAVRLTLDRGHVALGVRNGFAGLIRGDLWNMDWMDVHGWVNKGGAELGTNRTTPEGPDWYKMARQIEEWGVNGLLIIGGWTGYQTAYEMLLRRKEFPAFNIPIVCLPATINNDLPGTNLTIGADTALNTIIGNVDKIKESAVASRRVFVVEVMGRDCGYLALMSGLATGAERVYLPEEGITLEDLREDVSNLVKEFQEGKRLGLMIRSERADPFYTTRFISALFEKEGGDLFDVREAILGHVQRGGSPSPFDRIQATRLTRKAIVYLIDAAERGDDYPPVVCIGREAGEVKFTDLEFLPRLMESDAQRPRKQWWLEMRTVAAAMASKARAETKD